MIDIYYITGQIYFYIITFNVNKLGDLSVYMNRNVDRIPIVNGGKVKKSRPVD